jgi:hypothetical protein
LKIIFFKVKIFGIERTLNIVSNNIEEVLKKAAHAKRPEIKDFDLFIRHHKYILHNFTSIFPPFFYIYFLTEPADKEKKIQPFHYNRSHSETLPIKVEKQNVMSRARSDPEAELTRLRIKYLKKEKGEEVNLN